MAAASDMLRLKVLEQQGGGYFDADLLPAFKPNLWENMEIPASLLESDLNNTNFKLAKTQLVLEHLSEFFPHRKMLFDSNKYQDYAKFFAEKNPDYAKLINNVRIFIRNKGNTLSDFFQPLRTIKLHPDGILFAKNRDGSINNNAIFSHRNSGSIKLLQQQIENNYRFLRNHDLVFVDNTDVITDRINNYTDKITLALWNDTKASTRINGEIGNMLFRKDGIAPGSQATIFLSGPEMLERRIKSYSEQMFGQQGNLLTSSEEASFFIRGVSSDFNNFTEEDMASSWIQKTEESSQTSLIKRSDQLKEWSALGIENKPHQGNANQEKLYNDIRHHFDTLFLENTDKKLLKNIFSLQSKIQSYINKYQKFPSVPALKELRGKIHNILFPNTDFKRNQLGSILLISTIDLEQAAHIYMSIHDHNKHGKAEPNINALIFSDPYLQPFKGFTGEENDILQGKQGVFNAKFHIPLGNKFTVFKANLLAAQAQNVLNNVYLDEKTKIAHIGYSYNELTALKGNEHVGIILYTIILAIQEKKDSNFIGQIDLLMLKHFSNRRYLQDIRKERLADINKIGKSDPNTEIAEWDKHYSGQTGEQLQQRLLDKDLNINSWLDVLLENRKGLLISENNYGLDFVTRHLLDLKSKEITTIGLGVLNAKFAQPLIDAYLRTGNLSGELAVMVETNGLGKLFESAFAKKMKIIALGVDSRRKGIEEDDYENIYRIDKTNQGVVEAFNQPGEKFVAILSSEFLQSQPGIEGPLSSITHRLGLPAMTVNESGFTWLADNISQRKAYQPLSLNSIERSASFPHFSVTVDPGYQNILFTLDELHARVSNSGKINTACQLQQEIQQYIQRNPDSELNSRLITLKRQIDALLSSFDLPLRPGRGQKRKMLPAIFDNHGSREGKATPNQLSINAPSGQPSALGENTPATVKNTDVEHWQKPGVTIKDDGGDTAYDGQIVIQIEDDPIVAKAAADLAGKHPNTLLVQLDLEGNYHLLHGDAAQLRGKTNLRVQLVGHGRDVGVTASHITMGGQNNQQLAHHLNSFFDDFKRHSAIDIKPARIVLAGCSLVDLNQQNNFAEGFIRALNQEDVSVTAYSTDLVVADDGHRLIVDSEGNTRSARQGKIIYHRDQQGNVRAEISANLPTKLHWVAQQLDQLASGSTVKSLGCAARTMLQDAFHLSDGQLDRQKLLLSVHSPEKRQEWNKATRQLLQDPATYDEQANLSVQAALAQQQRSIQQQQQRSREFFQAGENTQKAHPRVEINAHLIPPWYSLREGIDTRRDSDAWSLAFLDAKQAGKTQYDTFSAGLAADAVRRVRIIEEIASGAELADSYHLHSQFEQLKNSAALSVDNPTIFTRHDGQDLFGATPAPGAYLLKGKYHSVALHIHQDESAGYRYSLYDPQVGSFDLTALSTGENRPALHSLLDSYLQGKDSAGQTRAQQYGIEKTSTGYAFDAYRVNIEQARALPPLGKLQTLLNNQVATRNLLSSITLDGVTLPAKILLDRANNI
ncbi:putative RTX-family protein-10 [Candidatus Regiella insecticola]|uniref:Putative RTX-family protein-10 n=2 Tax=Candidatus Regiella insecticola TaxID=138073 RepID=A0A6L2ZKR2_9ENTR|nr:putative RTX-family protein-10 [Candidatus Regiella insecticola]